MTIGEIDFDVAHFVGGNSNHRYLVSDRTSEELKKLYMKHFDKDHKWVPGERFLGDDFQFTKVEAIDFDQSGSFFMVYVEDCYSPPICIVRADNASDAQEAFLDELPWADIDADDAKELTDKDWDGGYYTVTNRGTVAHTESLMVQDIKLVRIDL